MIDERIKLEEYFKEEIDRVSEVEIHNINDEIAKIKEQSIESLDAEAKKEALLQREQEMRELQSDHAIALSKTREETNRKLMAKRKEFSENVFEEAKAKLKAFTKSDSYKDYLLEKAKKIASYNFDHVAFYVSKDDEQYLSDISKSYGLANDGFVDEHITLGGFRVECESKGVDLDETFDTTIEEQKEWFYTNSGLFIK